MLEQHLGQEAVLERDDAVVAGIAGRELGDARHAVAVVVAPGDDARAARRAQRRRVHVVVAQAVGGERVEVRRRDRAAVAAEVAEPGVVEDDEQHVRRALRRRIGAGHAGLDSSVVRPMTPGNAAPALYSTIAISLTLPRSVSSILAATKPLVAQPQRLSRRSSLRSPRSSRGSCPRATTAAVPTAAAVPTTAAHATDLPITPPRPTRPHPSGMSDSFRLNVLRVGPNDTRIHCTGMRPVATNWPPDWRMETANGAAQVFSQTSTAAMQICRPSPHQDCATCHHS